MKTRKTNSLVSLILARPLPRRLADARVGFAAIPVRRHNRRLSRARAATDRRVS
jgi:hypothetical protein